MTWTKETKILKFYGPACKEFEDLEEFAKEFPEVNIEALDAYERIDLVDIYNICRVPTYVVLKGNKEIQRVYNIKDLYIS